MIRFINGILDFLVSQRGVLIFGISMHKNDVRFHTYIKNRIESIRYPMTRRIRQPAQVGCCDLDINIA